MGLFSPGADANTGLALARIERKLDLILQSLGVAAPAESWEQDVRDIAAAGKKIEAIKLYRERTGEGLAEAKAAVDRM